MSSLCRLSFRDRVRSSVIWEELRVKARWGDSGFWLGCLLEASLVRSSEHVPPVGDPGEDPDGWMDYKQCIFGLLHYYNIISSHWITASISDQIVPFKELLLAQRIVGRHYYLSFGKRCSSASSAKENDKGSNEGPFLFFLRTGTALSMVNAILPSNISINSMLLQLGTYLQPLTGFPSSIAGDRLV